MAERGDECKTYVDIDQKDRDGRLGARLAGEACRARTNKTITRIVVVDRRPMAKTEEH